MPPPFVPESVVNDIKALPDTDPICIFMKHLALQSAQMDINDLGALSLKLEPYLKAVASRSTSSKLKDSPTVVYLQEAAELALVEPSVDGQKLRPTERFAQDLQDIALPYVEAFPNPPITMEYWKVLMLRNIAHAAKGLPKADVESANIHNLALSHAVDSCAHCGTTEGLLSKCSGCSNATESSRATQYCNRECQTKDWMRHKAECKKMQEQIAVSRAGAIFRAVYYIMRRRCFRTIYTDVKEEHDILWGCINVTAGLTLKGKFPSFPFVNKWDVSLEDEEALLSCNNCDEFAKVMLPIAEALFQGLRIDKVREVSIRVRAVKRATAWAEPCGRKYNNCHSRHEVLKIIMRSGNAFCMDITGGQYGWHDPVMAWPEFERKRLLVVRDDRPFGARLQEGVSALMSNNFPAYWMWFHLDMSLTYVLKHILQDWFKRRGITPAKLFSQPEAPFQQHLKNIKQYTTEAFDKKIAAYEKDKIWLYKETGPNKSTIICDIAKMGWVDADPKEVAQDLNSVGLKLFP